MVLNAHVDYKLVCSYFAFFLWPEQNFFFFLLTHTLSLHSIRKIITTVSDSKLQKQSINQLISITYKFINLQSLNTHNSTPHIQG